MRRQNLNKNRPDPQEPMINVTPLIDVVFVILIAFIVIAPLLELDRIELASGTTSHLPVRFEDAGPIQIHVHGNNSLFLNSLPVTLEELIPSLKALKQQYPDARAQLFHHKKAYFGTYQEIKNALELAEFKEMDVMLLPS